MNEADVALRSWPFLTYQDDPFDVLAEALRLIARSDKIMHRDLDSNSIIERRGPFGRFALDALKRAGLEK